MHLRFSLYDQGTNIAGGGWASFVQIRGSVPLFWEQTSSLTINPVPQLTRQVAFAVKAFTMHQVNQAALWISKVNLCFLFDRHSYTDTTVVSAMLTY